MTDKQLLKKEHIKDMLITIEEYISFLELALNVVCVKINGNESSHIEPNLGGEFYCLPADKQILTEHFVDYLYDNFDSFYSPIDPQTNKYRFPVFSGIIYVDIIEFIRYKELVKQEIHEEGMPSANGLANDFLNDKTIIFSDYADIQDVFTDSQSYMSLRLNAIESYKYILKNAPMFIDLYNDRVSALKMRCDDITLSVKQSSVLSLVKEEIYNHLVMFADTKYPPATTLNDTQLVVLCSYILAKLGFRDVRDSSLAGFIAALTGKNQETIRKIAVKVGKGTDMGYTSKATKEASLDTIKKVISNIDPFTYDMNNTDIINALKEDIDKYVVGAPIKE